MNHIRTYNSVDSVLEQEWLELWHTSALAHPFNSPMWFRASTKTYKYSKQLIVTVRNKRKLIAIVPLVQSTKFGVKTYTFPGNEHLDMSCLLMREHDREVLRSIVTFLARTETMYLQEVSEEHVENLHNSNHSLVIKKVSESPYLSLGIDPFKNMPESDKGKLFKKAKKFAQELRYQTYMGATGGLTLAFDIDDKSTKKKAGKATFTNVKNREFFMNIALEFNEMFQIDVLLYRDNPMVYSIGFIHNGIYYGMNTAYDLDLKPLIPGKMMLYYLLNRLMYEDMRLFYFSRGTNDLKRQFTDRAYIQYDVYFSKKPFVNVMWKSLNSLRESIVNSTTVYKAYKRVRIAARVS